MKLGLSTAMCFFLGEGSLAPSRDRPHKAVRLGGEHSKSAFRRYERR